MSLRDPGSKISLSQALTLYTTPVVFLYLERVNQWLARRSPAPAADRMLPPPSERAAD
jgi:hypothetical protein